MVGVSQADIAVVYRGDKDGEIKAHSVHREWLRGIGATELVVTDTPLLGPLQHTIMRDILLSQDLSAGLDHDVYVFESAASLYSAPFVRRQCPDATLLFLDTTWRTYGPPAYQLHRFSLPKRAAFYADRWTDAHILRWIFRTYLDGVITVSEMMRTHINTFSEVPVEITRPYIQNELAPRLREATPQLARNVAITVGASRDHKGFDVLVDTWPTVRERVPDARLLIAGKGQPDRYGEVEGIEVLGFVDDLAGTMSEASLQVHPARFDASPVCTLEGLLSGLPQLVTERTGTKSEVRQLNEELVVEPTREEIAAGVVAYFTSELSKRQTWSRTAREIGADFVESKRKNDFRSSIESLLA